jgi:cobalt-zinc-cadmium efflux system outer membrane protein
MPPALPSTATETPSMPMTARPAPAHPVGQPPPGLAEFERIALVRNPTLIQAFAQFDAVRSRSFQAGLYPNPIVGYVQDTIGALAESRPTTRGVTPSGGSSPGELVGGFLEQQIVTAGKLRLSRAKFVEEANAAQWQAVAQQFRVLGGVRIKFFEVLAAERIIQIERELARINEDAVRTTTELLNVGQANEPDLLQARIEHRRARVAANSAENRYRSRWESLVALVGAPELRPIWLETRPLESRAEPIDFDATLAGLLERSPEIHAARAEIRRSEVMVERERREPIPNIFLQTAVGYNYEFQKVTPNVQIGIPLPVFNRNQGTIREAMADLSRDHAELTRVALLLRQRLADTFNRYQDALQSVEDFRSESLPLARRAYEVQMANFRARRAAWPQVLVAERTYFDLNKDYVESLLELRRAQVEIGGMLLVDSLSPPATPTSQGHIESVPTPR